MTSDEIRRAKEAIASRDESLALELLQPLAQNGDREAQFLLGTRYYTGLNLVPLDEGLQWLRRASEAGHPEATYELALVRFDEDADGIWYGSPTTSEAVALLLRAGEIGYAEAQCLLGSCYATGEWAGPKDAAAARHWYQRAAEQSHDDAQSNLGSMFLSGEGGDVDVAQGLHWLEAAAAQDEVGALGYLQIVYRNGLYGVTPDPMRADELAKREKAARERYWEEFVARCVRDLSGPSADDAWHYLVEAGRGALPSIMHALESTRDPNVRVKLIRALLEHRAPETVQLLGRLLAEEAEVFKTALDALVSIGGSTVREVLDHAHRTLDVERQSWIAEAVQQIDEAQKPD